MTQPFQVFNECSFEVSEILFRRQDGRADPGLWHSGETARVNSKSRYGSGSAMVGSNSLRPLRQIVWSCCDQGFGAVSIRLVLQRQPNGVRRTGDLSSSGVLSWKNSRRRVAILGNRWLHKITNRNDRLKRTPGMKTRPYWYSRPGQIREPRPTKRLGGARGKRWPQHLQPR